MQRSHNSNQPPDEFFVQFVNLLWQLGRNSKQASNIDSLIYFVCIQVETGQMIIFWKKTEYFFDQSLSHVLAAVEYIFYRYERVYYI